MTKKSFYRFASGGLKNSIYLFFLLLINHNSQAETVYEVYFGPHDREQLAGYAAATITQSDDRSYESSLSTELFFFAPLSLEEIHPPVTQQKNLPDMIRAMSPQTLSLTETTQQTGCNDDAKTSLIAVWSDFSGNHFDVSYMVYLEQLNKTHFSSDLTYEFNEQVSELGTIPKMVHFIMPANHYFFIMPYSHTDLPNHRHELSNLTPSAFLPGLFVKARQRQREAEAPQLLTKIYEFNPLVDGRTLIKSCLPGKDLSLSCQRLLSFDTDILTMMDVIFSTTEDKVIDQKGWRVCSQNRTLCILYLKSSQTQESIREKIIVQHARWDLEKKMIPEAALNVKKKPRKRAQTHPQPIHKGSAPKGIFVPIATATCSLATHRLPGKGAYFGVLALIGQLGCKQLAQWLYNSASTRNRLPFEA